MNGLKTKESGSEFLQIDNGAIDYYFGLKFQTKLTFEKLVDVHNAMDSIQFELTDTGFKINATPKIQKHIPTYKVKNRRRDFNIKPITSAIDRIERELYGREDCVGEELKSVLPFEYNNGNFPHTNSTPLNSEGEIYI